jgi:hypothetical protein
VSQLKKYTAPSLQFIELRAEERIAIAVKDCTGACTVNIDEDGDGDFDYFALGS